MRSFIALAIAAVGIGAPATAAVTYTNYALNFTNGTTYVFPTPAVAPGEYQDIFSFSLANAATFSGSLTTQSLVNANGQYVSNLTFGNSLPSDGVFLTGGSLPGSLNFAEPTTSNGTSTENLASTLLGAGAYKLTVNYTVNAADAGHAATYAGPVFAASIAAVPEPASWALFIVGFGAVGAGLRSQRRARTALV